MATDKDLVFNVLAERYGLLGGQSNTHHDRRDMYRILGYPDEVTFSQFDFRFRRQDIAQRVVSYPPQETWSNDPIVYDGEEPPDYEDKPVSNTDFEKAWQDIVYEHQIYSVLERIDTLSGVGRYGVLLLGLDAGEDLTMEVGGLKGPDDLLYLAPYTEGNSEVIEWEKNPANKRFGLPKVYQLQTQTPAGETTINVHHSRVLHIAENTADRVYGIPRLEGIFNRLIDLEKLAGGGTEATWKLMVKGYALDINPEFAVEDSDLDNMREQIEEMDMGLRRFLMTRGVQVQDLGSEVVDPSGLYDMLIDLISSLTGIPRRVLLGSERGELASSQDVGNWARIVRRRRVRYAEPYILRKLIGQLSELGVLPSAQEERFYVRWKTIVEQSETDRARVVASNAAAVASFAQSTNITTPEEVRSVFLKLPPVPDMGELTPGQGMEQPEGEGEMGSDDKPVRPIADAGSNDNYAAKRYANNMMMADVDALMADWWRDRLG